MDHDRSYKLLFTHREVMRDFLKAFVADQWVSDADFSTLERENGEYISDDLRARADDIVWRIRCGKHMVYVVVEFQSSCDRFMAVRVLTYVGLLYQHLIRASKRRDIQRLPAILPIVLHSGQKPWSAADDVSALVSDVPRGLEAYSPRLRYLLIDQVCYDDAWLASRRNLAAMLFRIEGCRRRDVMEQLLSTLLQWLEGAELKSLRRAFATWLEKVIFKRLPVERGRVVNRLLEKPEMLSETVAEWEKELREEGWQKGHQKGLQEGVHELMARLLRKRFSELPELIGAQLRNASLGELEAWTERLLDAKSLDEVLSILQPARADN